MISTNAGATNARAGDGRERGRRRIGLGRKGIDLGILHCAMSRFDRHALRDSDFPGQSPYRQSSPYLPFFNAWCGSGAGLYMAYPNVHVRLLTAVLAIHMFRRPARWGTEDPVMKVANSLKTLKKRHKKCRLVRRRGRVFVINKENPRFKARQG